MVFLTVTIWLILSLVLASAASKKGRSFGGFLAAGLFLSPLLGFIILLLMGENKEALQEKAISSGTSRICPFCANAIKSEAVVCQHCGRDLPAFVAIKTATEMTKAAEGATDDVIDSIGLFEVTRETELHETPHCDQIVGYLQQGETVEHIKTVPGTSVKFPGFIHLIRTAEKRMGYCPAIFLTKKED